jgi:hypothetical protein
MLLLFDSPHSDIYSHLLGCKSTFVLFPSEKYSQFTTLNICNNPLAESKYPLSVSTCVMVSLPTSFFQKVCNLSILYMSLTASFLFPGIGQLVSDWHGIYFFFIQPGCLPRSYV